MTRVFRLPPDLSAFRVGRFTPGQGFVYRRPEPAFSCPRRDDPDKKPETRSDSPATVAMSAHYSDVERDMIRFARDRHAGRMSEMAGRPGIGRPALYRKFKEYGIGPEAVL